MLEVFWFFILFRSFHMRNQQQMNKYKILLKSLLSHYKKFQNRPQQFWIYSLIWQVPKPITLFRFRKAWFPYKVLALVISSLINVIANSFCVTRLFTTCRNSSLRGKVKQDTMCIEKVSLRTELWSPVALIFYFFFCWFQTFRLGIC